MTVKIKIFCDTLDKLEKQVNQWIKDTKMTPIRRIAEKTGVQVLHTHVVAIQSDKVCILFFYKEFPAR